MQSLKERFLQYEAVSDFILPGKLPIIINLNGRNFKKATALIEKPYDNQLQAIFEYLLIKLASEIDGTKIIYSFNDEIVVVIKNDQNLDTELWYKNNIQKISSVVASISSAEMTALINKNNIPFVGLPIFSAKTFVLPSVVEVVNFLIYKQHQSMQQAIHNACFYELTKKYNREYANKVLDKITFEEKNSILFNDLNISLSSFPLGFWRGVACYREARELEKDGEPFFKQKLKINNNLPFFDKEQEFLYRILI